MNTILNQHNKYVFCEVSLIIIDKNYELFYLSIDKLTKIYKND